MKKIYLSIITIFTICSFSFGQTAHNLVYLDDREVVSMVTVSNAVDKTSFIVGTDNEGYIFIGQLTNEFPQDLVNPECQAFKIDGNEDFFLNGGFVDQENNIVVYGYQINLIPDTLPVYLRLPRHYGFIAKIKMSGNTAECIYYSISKKICTPVEDGCYSEDVNGEKTYDFIVGSPYFMRVPASLSGVCVVKNFTNATDMSVSWEPYTKRHVISGCTSDTSYYNFIGTLYDSSSNIYAGNIFRFTSPSYNPSEGTNKHILSEKTDTIAYLLQDLRSKYPIEDTSDVLWFMKVNYLNGNVYDNCGYKYDNSKLNIIDATHNFNSLFVLGHHNGVAQAETFECRYIAQINLVKPSDMIVKHMMDVDLYNLSPLNPEYVLYRAYLNNICYNHKTNMVQAAGAIPGKGFLVENKDMSKSSCDSIINYQLKNIAYTRIMDTTFCNGAYLNTIWSNNIYNHIEHEEVCNYIMYKWYAEKQCVSEKDLYNFNTNDNPQQIRENQSVNQEENLQNQNTLEMKGKIDIIEEKTFVCNDFEGICTYKVYDIYGRLIDEGTTQNGNYNKLDIDTAGLYLICVQDINNNIRAEKIVISE